MPIDTRQIYKDLLEAGVPEPQADVQARVMGTWTEDRLVTREYLDQRLETQEARFDAKLAEVEARIDKRFVELEARIDQRFVELEARIDQRFVELEARIDQRLVELEARFDKKLLEQDARFKQALAEGLADLDKRLTTRIYTAMGIGVTILGVLIAVFNFLG